MTEFLLRYRIVAFAALLGSHSAFAAEALLTQNIILVTLDGVRVQEIFAGLDETIARHDQQQVYSEIEMTRKRYGGDSPAVRRTALMPAFWERLAPQGVVLGNANYGNRVLVQNKVLWSTPGYTEIMTGRPRLAVVDNDNQRHDYVTVMEVARSGLELDGSRIAQIGSWEGFKFAAASQDHAFVMVGAHDSVPTELSSPAMDDLADLRREVMGLWEEGSNDVLTFRMALAYLQAHQPRVMWLALVNSDDWAHADRYDRYLEYLHLADSLIGELWDTVQSLEQYRGKTTLIITTDHGRGRQGSDWAEHDITIPGSEDIWLAIIGPDTPDLGEVTGPGTVYQGQVAATMLQFLGIDYRQLEGALPPVAAAFDQPAVNERVGASEPE